jgi:hypothetical protein
MSQKIFFLLALGAISLPCPVLAEVQSYALSAGPNAVGVALVKPAWLTGTIGAVDPNGLRVQDPALVGSSAAAPLIWDNQPAYLEISQAPSQPTLVGERYEIEVSANPSAHQGWIRLKTAPHNTRRDLPAGLVGARYSVRPHWTLGNLFGTSGRSFLRPGRTSSSADQVQITDPASGSPESYFLSSEPSAPGWRSSRNRRGPEQNQVIIPPGSALILHARGPLVFSLYGEARAHAFRLPLRSGPNFVSLGHPRSFRLADLAGNQPTAFRASAAPASADRISFLVGNRQEIFSLLLQPQGIHWVCTTSTYPTDVKELDLFPPNRAFWIHKQQADPGFTVPARR